MILMAPTNEFFNPTVKDQQPELFDWLPELAYLSTCECDEHISEGSYSILLRPFL